MSNELKPCPFCGCTEIRFHRTSYDDGVIECMNCDAGIYVYEEGAESSLRNNAIKKWNTRVDAFKIF